MLDKLNIYKKNWKDIENSFIKKSDGGMFGGDETIDSTNWKKDWNPLKESIERAIKKRELINNKNFTELRNQHYSNNQLLFKNAIEGISQTEYEAFSEKLGDVSTLTLTQIADSIVQIQEYIKNNGKEETTQTKPSEVTTPTRTEETKTNGTKVTAPTRTEETKTTVTEDLIKTSGIKKISLELI